MDIYSQALAIRNTSAMAIATSGQHFLEFSYENRLRIYRRLGVIFSRPIYGPDLKCHCIGEKGDLVPLCIPEKLFDISKEVSADALVGK
jgi:hypothetical protein